MVLVTSLRRSLTTAFPDEETEVQRSPIAKSHKVSALVEAFHPEPLVLPRVCLWSASSQSDKKKKKPIYSGLRYPKSLLGEACGVELEPWPFLAGGKNLANNGLLFHLKM